MVARQRLKRENLLAEADDHDGATGNGVTAGSVFEHASDDDLQHYSAHMLRLAAQRSAADVAAWDQASPFVKIEPVEGVTPDGAPVSVLTVTERNMPFLYESVMGEVTSSYRDILLAVHPILAGKDIAGFGGSPEERVSHIQIHLAPLTNAQSVELEERIRHVLNQVRLSVSDWKPMLERIDTVVAELTNFAPTRRKAELEEALAFLNWLRNDNFTFLGMREYIYSGSDGEATVERDAGSGLGILTNPDVRVLRQGANAVTTTPEILAFLEGPDFLIVTKANAKSVVHRRTHMDYVGVKRFDEKGRVTGELRIVGLFTSTAYTSATDEVPLLRLKVQRVKQHFAFDPTSHSGRMLSNTLESYPRDDLFQIDTNLLVRFAEQINDLSDRPRVRVLARADQFDRFVSVIVYVPREEYDSIVREKIGIYLRTVFDGRVSAYYPAFPEPGLARVHFIIGRSGGKTPKIAQAALEEQVRAITARWADRFRMLAGPKVAPLAVSNAFQEAFSPEEALADLPHVEACLAGASVRISFYYRDEPDRGRIFSLKIFHKNEQLPLSRRVPLLENLGFNVLSERTFDIETSRNNGDAVVVLHDMELEPRNRAEVDLALYAPLLEEAFVSAFEGRIDNDGFNRLILSTGLSAKQANVLRAYARYLRQTGITYSQDYIASTLDRYPAVTKAIFRLFEDTHHPAIDEKARLKRVKDIEKSIEQALGDVPVLDDDRILRRYVNVVDATLRTNYFQKPRDPASKTMLAFKLDPHMVDGLPQPLPYREIFVYGVDVEGVHLRFGPVARGGLRWSDRAEDYRTEVLGLVKAQQVKNAVIVPVGAKGGFYPKNLPAAGSRDEIFSAGRDAYKIFIRTLLSITDNIVGPEVVPPADTLRLDGDDPYFVVAADKGTATFSDTANGLAIEAGFWLDDAFASGGSAGYDHKKMGITARGAWETVKRHFREVDIDIQTTPFTVAGVGDMSGDVFGNGMLLSRKIRLLAAFDHRDIFIDPDPDMEKTFAERQRLFDLPRSSWQDFNKALLSKGGMIISRSAKSVALTAEAMEAIGLEKATATPFEIMTAILRSPVDLLWFGGIGTYIKAASETDADVGDRANDAIRIAADEVRARVIGEGANLGMTQKARIAYGLRGGRSNSDAIDNSAGVNTSDVEVNIKIGLSAAMQDNRLSREERNRLLASMTDEVASLVLRNNYLQSLAISLSHRKGNNNALELNRLMTVLESAKQLNRKVETLPDDAAFAERYASGKPLTRAEIGVLLSYAKIVLFDALTASDLPDDPYFSSLLAGYFPTKMQKKHAAEISGHRLRREIVATVLANDIINFGGPAFVVSMMDATAATAAEVVRAAVIARDGFRLGALWAAVDRLDNRISGENQNAIYEEISFIFTVLTRVILKSNMMEAIPDAIDQLQSALKKLRPAFASFMGGELAEREARFAALGLEADMAGDIAALGALPLVPEILQIAARTGANLARSSESYFAVSQTFRVGRLLAAGTRISTSDHYENLALSRSLDQIALARRDITVSALSEHADEKAPVQAWHAKDRVRVNRVAQELVNMGDADLNLPRITVAAGLLSDLARSVSK